jgi:hypothetical protein
VSRYTNILVFIRAVLQKLETSTGAIATGVCRTAADEY